MKPLFLTVLIALFLFSCVETNSSDAAASMPDANTEEATIDSSLIRFENEVEAYEKADLVRRPVKGVCLFTGSSSVRLWRQLEGDVKPLPVINRGFGGSTFRELNHYFDRLVLPYRPKMVVVYEGDNDIVEPEVNPEDVLAGLETFRRQRDEKLPRMKIFMMAVKPSPSRRVLLDKARETNALLEAYCDTAAGVTFLDTFSPIMNSDGSINGSYFTGDSLHMNQQGYDAWVAEILDPLLAAYAE